MKKKRAFEVTSRPETGVNIHGLYLQGANWSWDKLRLEESRPGELFIEMPVIWLEPVLFSEPST